VVEEGTKIISEYDHKDMYDMNETALIYGMQPGRTNCRGPLKGFNQESRGQNHPCILPQFGWE
jgi:hypothetical protein